MTRGSARNSCSDGRVAGLGVTLLPSIAVEAETARAQVRTRAFAPPSPYRTLVLAWRPRSPLRAALASVAAVIREGLAGRTR